VESKLPMLTWACTQRSLEDVAELDHTLVTVPVPVCTATCWLHTPSSVS
jgi:hypothetical protein